MTTPHELTIDPSDHLPLNERPTTIVDNWCELAVSADTRDVLKLAREIEQMLAERTEERDLQKGRIYRLEREAIETRDIALAKLATIANILRGENLDTCNEQELFDLLCRIKEETKKAESVSWDNAVEVNVELNDCKEIIASQHRLMRNAEQRGIDKAKEELAAVTAERDALLVRASTVETANADLAADLKEAREAVMRNDQSLRDVIAAKFAVTAERDALCLRVLESEADRNKALGILQEHNLTPLSAIAAERDALKHALIELEAAAEAYAADQSSATDSRCGLVQPITVEDGNRLLSALKIANDLTK